MKKKLTIEIVSEKLTLADIHLALRRAEMSLTRDVVHTLPPAVIHAAVQGVDLTMTTEAEPFLPATRVRVRRSQLEGCMKEVGRVARLLEGVQGTAHVINPDHAIRVGKKDLEVVYRQLEHLLDGDI